MTTHPMWVATNSKQANRKLRVAGCAFREKALILNSQLATSNLNSRLRYRRHRLKTGRGTRDEGRNELRGRGPCRAENGSDWRLRRQKLLSAENFSAVQELCPPEKPFATHYSPFATRRSLLATHYSPFATRHSLFAVVSLAAHFYSSPASPFPAFCFAAMMSARI